jgi:hypothetical protein
MGIYYKNESQRNIVGNMCAGKGLMSSLAIAGEHGAEMFHFCARWEFNDRQATVRF